jgi:hypothetical protein
MSTTDHSENAACTASDIAVQLRDAGFVRLVAMPDGDSLAATGVLARILDIPFQASITREEIDENEADVTVTVGRSDGDVALTDEPIAASAVAVARVLDEDGELDPDEAVLALAGIVAAEHEPEAHSDVLKTASLDSRPGVGIPIDDHTDGLAHTTLVHAPFSGDRESTSEALATVDDDDRTIASLLALSAVDETETRASKAIERAIQPYVLDSGAETETGTFATLAGYADVLNTLARSQSGIGLAVALGYDCHETALDGWREHAHTAHAAVHTADLVRYHGLTVAEVPSAVGGTGTVETVARLVRDYRSLEPVVLVIAGDEIAGAAIEQDITTEATKAATAVDASASGRGQRVYAQLSSDDEDTKGNEGKTDAFIEAFREAL